MMQNNYSLTLIAALLVFFLLTPLGFAQKAVTKKTPKEELDELMNEVLPFAQKMLVENGEFYPYGGAITAKGEIIFVGAQDGNEHADSQDLMDILIGMFQAQGKSGAYRATALVVDVTVKQPPSEQKTDAIQIRLDHVDGTSVECFLPYQITGKNKVVYGEMYALKGSAKIFKRE